MTTILEAALNDYFKCIFINKLQLVLELNKVIDDDNFGGIIWIFTA